MPSGFAGDRIRCIHLPASTQWHEAHATKNATKPKLSGVCGKDADLLPATLWGRGKHDLAHAALLDVAAGAQPTDRPPINWLLAELSRPHNTTCEIIRQPKGEDTIFDRGVHLGSRPPSSMAVSVSAPPTWCPLRAAWWTVPLFVFSTIFIDKKSCIQKAETFHRSYHTTAIWMQDVFSRFNIRRSVDYSEHENWRSIVSAMNALNETPNQANGQENSSLPL
jgi:hypothetical protein